MTTQIQLVIAKAKKDPKFEKELKIAASKALDKQLESAEMEELFTMFFTNPKSLSPKIFAKNSGTTTITTVTTFTSLACLTTTTTTTTTDTNMVNIKNDKKLSA